MKSLYKSKKRMEKAKPSQKASSKYQRKLNNLKKLSNNLRIKILVYLEQIKRDRELIFVLKKDFPDVYEKIIPRLELSKEKLKDFKKGLKEENYGKNREKK